MKTEARKRTIFARLRHYKGRHPWAASFPCHGNFLLTERCTGGAESANPCLGPLKNLPFDSSRQRELNDTRSFRLLALRSTPAVTFPFGSCLVGVVWFNV